MQVIGHVTAPWWLQAQDEDMLSSSSALGRNYHTVLTACNPLLIITGERTYRCGNMKSYWWKYQSFRQELLTLSRCQRSTLAAGHCLSDNIDMASQHNENSLMPLRCCNDEIDWMHWAIICIIQTVWHMPMSLKKRDGFIWLVSITSKHIIYRVETAVVYKREQWKMWQLWQISGFITEQ